MAKLILFEEVTGNLSWVECNDLDDYYKHLDCRCFDIVNVTLDGQELDIYVDDEGLLVHRPLSALDDNMQPRLVGNLIFARINEEGETIDCKPEDMNIIKKRVVMLGNLSQNEVIKVLWLREE